MPTKTVQSQRTLTKWTGWVATILLMVAWGLPVATAVAATQLKVSQVTWSAGAAAVNIRGSGAGDEKMVLFMNADNGQQIGSTRSNEDGSFIFSKQGLNPAPCKYLIKGYDGRTLTTGYTSSPPVVCSNAPKIFTISASAGANGAISPSGGVSVAQGASQVFTITANAGYQVQSVLVDGASVGAVTSYTFSNVTAAHSISATFAVKPSTTFTISASAGANGAISPSGSVSVAQGASQAFTITANAGYQVQSVLVDGASVGAVTSYTFSNVTAAHSISATFAVKPSTTFTISASAGANGAISPSGSVSVAQGASQAFTITANAGYQVQSVLVDGASVGAVTSYTFSNVTAAHSISATFAVKATALTGTYQVFAFNDLGMHCYDPDFSVFSILPVFNVLHAQVVQKGTVPTVMGSAVNVTYKALADATGSINTTSIGKTNFWDNVLMLFGANPPLDVGLLGAKMPGAGNQPEPFSWAAGTPNWFGAAGVPITALDDNLKINSFPLMAVEASDPSNAKVLSSLPVVVPISNEMACNVCHATGNVAAALSGVNWSQNTNAALQFRENILLLHDYRHSTNLDNSQPVLCASCHYSPALDLGHTGPNPTQQLHKTMSQSVHGFHASRTNILPPSGNACYYCHPGEKTQCARGAMNTAGLTCLDCHGTMNAVAQPTRRPWADLPKCQSCHTGDATTNLGGQIIRRSSYTDSPNTATPIVATNKRFAEQDNTLYRNSVGHSGVSCESCHGSPHAEWPSREANDNQAAITIQGHDGTITECTACHGTGLAVTANGGPHGMHNVNSSAWVSAHHSYASLQACGTCHGATLNGTVISKAAANRTIGGRSIPKGTQVNCTLCHGYPF